jgi:hypothetical protein
MGASTDRLLTRLWVAFAGSSVLAASLHLGAAVGAGDRPGRSPDSLRAASREAGPSGCQRHLPPGFVPSHDGTRGGLVRNGQQPLSSPCEASPPPS